MTPTPRANPPSATRNQRNRDEVSTSAESAKKLMPTVIACVATPQQAAEKKPELSIAANPPNVHAAGASRKLRKKNQAPIPRMSRATNASSFEKPNGPKIHKTR